MKKLWLLALGVVVLLLGGLIAVRFAAKGFVESEEFRAEFSQMLEQAAGSVLPHAMAKVQRIRLGGIASLDLEGIKIETTKSVAASLEITHIRATPSLFSLLGKSPVLLSADGEVAGKGTFSFTARVPKTLFAGEPGKRSETLEVQGHLEHVDVVPVASLLFADAPSNPNFQLTRGHLTGTFTFKKPFGGHSSQGRKSGDINAKLESPVWSIAVGPVKKLEPPNLDLHVEIKDFALELRAPVVLEDKVGRATFGGSLLLPERADRTLAWDLDVKTGGLLVQGSLAKLFKCKSPPLKPHFTVKGPIAETTCR